jgi:hypothetical protein
MVDKLFRYLVVGMLFAGLTAGSLNRGSMASAAEQGGFSASSAVLIGSSGQYIGAYSMSEPPGYPAAECVGHGIVVDMYSPGYVFVSSSVYALTQKAVIAPVVYQRLANGSYSKLYTGGNIQIPLNSNNPVAVPIITSFLSLPIGPDYVYAFHIEWQRAADSVFLGSVDVANTIYHRTIDGNELPNGSVCGGLKSPSVVSNTTTGTVNSVTPLTLQYFPTKTVVPITWDGKQIGSVTTGPTSFTNGSFVVPAAPMGPHTVQFNYGHWSAKFNYVVKPRIKLIPSTVGRGQTVNVSLRGFAKYETVNIRWKKGTSWVQIGQVKTSSTGSANVYLKVPTWAPNGSASVRGDGTYGHAQTNAITVSGGAPLTSSAVKTATPTPTATPAATSTPIPSATPDLPAASPTAVPTESATPAEETPVATETATPESSPTTTAEAAETPSPT